MWEFCWTEWPCNRVSSAYCSVKDHRINTSRLLTLFRVIRGESRKPSCWFADASIFLWRPMTQDMQTHCRILILWQHECLPYSRYQCDSRLRISQRRYEPCREDESYPAHRMDLSALYFSVSETVVRGPQVVLGFCPCGPFRLNISPKKTEKIKLTWIAYHTP